MATRDPRMAQRLRRMHYRMSALDGAAPFNDHAHHKSGCCEVVHGNQDASLEKLRDQMLRQQAEFDNFRKRIRRDEESKIQQANVKLIEALLPALDNSERAISAPGDSVESLLSGVKMVQQQFIDGLGQFGLTQIEAEGQVFDPNQHEAVAVGAEDDVEENTILEVFQTGYMLHDRLLRPAMVKVCKK